MPRRGAQPHDVEQFQDPPTALRLVAEAVQRQRLVENPVHGTARRKRRIGILEDHLHVLALALESRAVERRDVDAVEQYAARGGLVQAQDGAAQRGLAAAGFADQAESPATLEFERHAVDRAQHLAGAAQEPGAYRKVARQLPDFEQRAGHADGACSPAG